MLDSVVDSIESPQVGTYATTSQTPVGAQTPPDSSPARRHRALADALFGVDERAEAFTRAQSTPAVGPLTVSKSQEQLTSLSSTLQTHSTVGQAGLAVKRTQSMRGASKPPVADDNMQLALEMQRKVEAATALLRKTPSNPRITGKKISPNQISSPTLVSSSTIMDTVPLPHVSPQHQASSLKIGSRIKKLRGTLRTKVPPAGEDIAPYPLTSGTPPSVQSVSFPHGITSPRVEPALLSAPDTHFKISSPPPQSPPNTAAPGLKGFMARFRKQRNPDVYVSPQRRTGPSSVISATSSYAGSSPPLERSFGHPTSAPPSKMEFIATSAPATRAPPPQSPPPRPPTAQSITSQAGSSADQSALVKQLYDAASNLGIDQAALNALLNRSNSVSSHTAALTDLSRIVSETESIREPVVASESRRSIDAASPRSSSSEGRQIPIIRQPPAQPPAPTQRSRDPKPNQGQNAIVRRTIIVPSDARASGFDLYALMRKQSSARRRRSASAASVHSTRSIQDRVPTPPPHRSGSGRRFSTDTSPPVPQLPSSFSTQTDSTLVPPGQMEKSNSTYESL